MNREVIHSDDAPAALGPYSQAVAVSGGRMVFCSGQVALDTQGNLVGEDAAAQTRQIMANLGAVLAAAGSTFEQVVRCTIYLTDQGDYSAVNAVYAEYFGSAKPSRGDGDGGPATQRCPRGDQLHRGGLDHGSAPSSRRSRAAKTRVPNPRRGSRRRCSSKNDRRSSITAAVARRSAQARSSSEPSL